MERHHTELTWCCCSQSKGDQYIGKHRPARRGDYICSVAPMPNFIPTSTPSPSHSKKAPQPSQFVAVDNEPEGGGRRMELWSTMSLRMDGRNKLKLNLLSDAKKTRHKSCDHVYLMFATTVSHSVLDSTHPTIGLQGHSPLYSYDYGQHRNYSPSTPSRVPGRHLMTSAHEP
jgi:hypothetical protein